MARPAKTLTFKPEDLWSGGGTVWHLGPVIVKFLRGGRGRRGVIECYGKVKPRLKRLPSKIRKR